MNLIERAAQRLEELKRAGVEIPDVPDDVSSAANAPTAPPTQIAEVVPLAAITPAAVAPAVVDVNAAPVVEKVVAPSRVAYARAPVQIDLQRMASLGFVTPDVPRSRIADEFRHLKRTLIANTTDNRSSEVKHPNLVMITSAVPGEGKTFSAVNLAMSLAVEVDKSVLLVDADVARPSIPNILGLPEAKGLLDCLEDPSLTLDDVIMPTNVEKLTILSSGASRNRATELLSSAAMLKLLDELSERHPDRIVVLDSPPMLATTEARALATHMGQIVFVVRAESTSRRDVQQGLAALEACPIKLLLLNQSTAAEHHAYGYYGYGAH
jgi:protein-tyrosine kinase